MNYMIGSPKVHINLTKKKKQKYFVNYEISVISYL